MNHFADRFDDARDILVDFERRVDGLALVNLRRIGIERRRAVYDALKVKEDPDADGLLGTSTGVIVAERASTKPNYSQVTARYERIIHDPTTPVRVASFYAVKFARFQAKVRQDRRLAEKILNDALTKDKV